MDDVLQGLDKQKTRYWTGCGGDKHFGVFLAVIALDMTCKKSDGFGTGIWVINEHHRFIDRPVSGGERLNYLFGGTVQRARKRDVSEQRLKTGNEPSSKNLGGDDTKDIYNQQ